jgi:hypothetical protein
MYFKILTKNMEAPFNKEFIYKLNKKYIIDNNEPIELCKNGFHYFNNTDNIFSYESFFNNKYRIFEVKPEGNIIEDSDKCCCSEITLLRESSFKDLLDYDNTGLYTYYYALCNNDKKIDISKLEDTIIEKDKDGYWCYKFACDINGANINKLEDAVIEKDKDGEWCYKFACDINGANINKLEDAVIEKDIDSFWCYVFAKHIENANIQKLEDTVIKKDNSGYYCCKFAMNVKNANISKLEDAIIEKDNNNGYWCHKFARDVEGANISKLKNATY